MSINNPVVSIPPEPIQQGTTQFGTTVYKCLYARHPFSAQAAVVGANRLFAMLFRLEYPHTLSSYWVRYNSSGTRTVRTGIYPVTSNKNFFPGSLIAGTEAELQFISQAGQVENLSTPYPLYAGWFWQAILLSVTESIMIVNADNLHYMGNTFSSVAGPGTINGLRFDMAYGALPDPFPSGAVPVTTDVPFIGTYFSD